MPKAKTEKEKSETKKGKRRVVKAPEKIDPPKLSVVGRIVKHTGREEGHKIRGKILKLKTQIDGARWELAESLFEVQGGVDGEKKLFHLWGYTSWDGYVTAEVGTTVRTAQYLVGMYKKFALDVAPVLGEESQEKKEAFLAAVKELGWTKGRLLVKVITPENAIDWVERAGGMTTAELEEAIKVALGKGKSGGDDDDFERMSFKLAEEQKAIVDKAMLLAKDMLDSEKKGHQISMICQDFYSTNAVQNADAKKKSDIQRAYLAKMGAIFGVHFVAIDRETGQVVHGKDFLDKVKE
jgi:hypothetical protein